MQTHLETVRRFETIKSNETHLIDARLAVAFAVASNNKKKNKYAN